MAKLHTMVFGKLHDWTRRTSRRLASWFPGSPPSGLALTFAPLTFAACQILAGVDRDAIPDGGTGGGGGTTANSTGTWDASSGGGQPACLSVIDCPGMDTECHVRTCVGGVCGVKEVAAGTPATIQVAADCKRRVCDGAGRVQVIDDADVFDDHNECTTDACVAGKARNTPRAAGSACGPNGSQVCDGFGRCVACVSAAQCGALLCANNLCVPETCLDHVKDGDETDVDCGGAHCARCDAGNTCKTSIDCADGVCGGWPLRCVTPSCTDGLNNGKEADLDCGGTCPSRCGLGAHCYADTDCIGGACSGSTCLPSCTDGQKDGNETGKDCGGGVCPACEAGGGCLGDSDCAEGVMCQAGLCVPVGCFDGHKGAPETDVDCGGVCAPCRPGKGCQTASDCISGVCAGTLCAKASCADGVKNGDETGVDCGGPTCGKCLYGQPCSVPSDCSGVCHAGLCVAVGCTDGILNLDETDVDCGGSCPGCAGGAICLIEADCSSLICNSGVCAMPTCEDSLKNGAETDVDCGGPCFPCPLDQHCKLHTDCEQGRCSGGTCAPPTCNDGVHDGEETGVDCGGPICGACPGGQGCGSPTDCASGVCTATLCEASCSDKMMDGKETGVDCGGTCAGCPPGNPCLSHGDCSSGICTDGMCAAPTCHDGVKNGSESDVDCGGSACGGCINGKACAVGADCGSMGCHEKQCIPFLLISEMRTHGKGGPPFTSDPLCPFNDEFIELFNPGNASVTLDASWQVYHRSAQGGCQGSGMGGPRFVGSGQVIPPYRHFLLSGFQYAVGPSADAPMINSSAVQSLADAGSITLLHGTLMLDSICYYYDTTTWGYLTGGCAQEYVCRGTPVSNLPHNGGSNPSSDVDASLERKPGGALGSWQDTGEPAADFQVITPSRPQNLASTPTPP